MSLVEQLHLCDNSVFILLQVFVISSEHHFRKHYNSFLIKAPVITMLLASAVEATVCLTGNVILNTCS